MNQNDSRPRVSVILIFFNDEKFLDEAIRSVLTQTIRDWELLLVDDGSTDRSTMLARRYADQIGRIRYLEHPRHQNCGKSSSRNLGMHHAQGEYLLCLDSDDILLPHALEAFIRLLDTHPAAAMVYGPLRYWYSWTIPPYGRRADFVQPLGVAPDALIEPPALLLGFLRRRAAVPSGMLVRASVVQEIGGYEGAFRWMYDDQVFCAKVCLAWPVLTSSTCVYCYRQHAASSSAVADASREYELGRLPFLEWLASYLISQGRTDPEMWQAVRTELWWTRHPRLGRLRKIVRRAGWRLNSVARTLTVRPQPGRPLGYTDENSSGVGEMTGSGARLEARTPESEHEVTSKKP